MKPTRPRGVLTLVVTRARCEVTLWWMGGRDLLRDARAEATWYVDLYHPWDGTGTVPPARAAAWLRVLQQRRRRFPR